MSEYWHKRKELPSAVKEAIKKLTRGDEVETFTTPDGEKMRLLKADASVFSLVFSLNREFLFRGDYTAPVDENDYDDSDCYLAENGLSGFAISDSGWLTSLYSNQTWQGFSKIIARYVYEKANKLVCISSAEYEDSPLALAYAKNFGFKYFARTENDTEIMRRYYGDEFIDGFVKNNGAPHHIFMVRTEKEIREIRRFDDYFEAYDYVNGAISPIECTGDER